MDLFERIFTSDELMPLGHCYLWNPGLVWLHLASNLLIGCSFLATAVLLYTMVRRAGLPRGALVSAFGVFVGACGLSHLVAAITLWEPIYWVEGVLKAAAAVASLATAIFFVPLRHRLISPPRATGAKQ